MSIQTDNQATVTLDYDTIKSRHKQTWENGDYANFATYMEAGAIEILENWNITPGKRLLDIGCGAGQTAIPAAKLGHQVTGIDLAANLVETARNRASMAGLVARFDQGDAEDLPYENASFDNIITLIGAMFAPRPDKVVSECVRVLKPGGKLYMANWTPASMPAQMFKCVAGITPPPAGLASPVLWGDEATVLERLSEDFTDIQLHRFSYPQWDYPFDCSEIVELFREQFGPVRNAFNALGVDKHQDLHDQLEAIYRRNSTTVNGITTITGGELLNVVATRR